MNTLTILQIIALVCLAGAVITNVISAIKTRKLCDKYEKKLEELKG